MRVGLGSLVSANLFALLSLKTVLLGFGVRGLSDPKYDTSVTTPWIFWSIVADAAALGLTLFIVVPAMRTAVDGLESCAASGVVEGVAAVAAGPSAEAANLSSRGYPPSPLAPASPRSCWARLRRGTRYGMRSVRRATVVARAA